MTTTIVDRLHAEFADLVRFLDEQAEPSLRNTAEESFRKALLLSAASYFEVQLTDTVLTFVRDQSPVPSLVPEFVRLKALVRQYHALFDWDSGNANKFFALFGESFRKYMQSQLKADPKLAAGVSAFIDLGSERNRLVHLDFGTFALEKTADEIYDLYLDARVFVEALRSHLDGCTATLKAASSSF